MGAKQGDELPPSHADLEGSGQGIVPCQTRRLKGEPQVVLQRSMSALALKADICGALVHVMFDEVLIIFTPPCAAQW